MITEILNLSKHFRYKTKIQHPYYTVYSYWIPLLLTASYLIIIGKEHSGKPMVCHAAGPFDKEYVDAFCWSFGTHTVPMSDKSHISLGVGQSKDTICKQDFYKNIWILWISLCVLFHMPSKVWKFAEAKRTEKLCKGVLENFKGADEDLSVYVRGCVMQLHFKDKTSASYLWKYLLCTAWSALNPVVAMAMIDYAMGGKFRYLGISLFTSNDDTISDFEQAFPFQAKCTVTSYGPSGNAQRFDSICQLPINTFNRALFPCLWFLLVGLAVFGVFFFVNEFIVNIDTEHAGKARIPTKTEDFDNCLSVLVKCKSGTLFLLKQIERNVPVTVYEMIFEMFVTDFPENIDYNV